MEDTNTAMHTMLRSMVTILLTIRNLIATRRCTTHTRSTQVTRRDRIIMRKRLKIILDFMEITKVNTAKVNSTQIENKPKKMMTSIPDLKTPLKKLIDLNVGLKNSQDN